MRVTQIAIIHDHLVASYDMQGQDIGAILAQKGLAPDTTRGLLLLIHRNV